MSAEVEKSRSNRNRRGLITEDEVLVRPFNSHYLLRAFSYLKPYKKEVIVSLLALIISALASLASPKLFQLALDDYITVGKFDGLIWISLIIVATAAISSLMLRVKIRVMNVTGRRAIANMREELFEHIQELSFDFFDSRSAGKIMIRVINDINSLLNLFSQGIVNLMSNIFTIVLIIILMLSLNIRLALVSFCALPFLVLIIFLIKPKISNSWRSVRYKSSSLNAYLHESLAGMKVSQAFVREAENSRIFMSVSEELRSTWMKAIFWSALLWPTFQVIQAVGNTLIYYYGVKWIFDSSITIGTLFAMTWYLGRFWDPLNQLSNIYNEVLVAMASLERIFEIMDTPVQIKNAPDAVELPKVQGAVEFDHVTFGYDFQAGQIVLDDVSFTVEPGQAIALVGPTGAGKSTVVSLLTRFYDANLGHVMIDGYNVKSVTLRSLRKQMGIMLQDSFIFSGTIMENIRYGRLDATDDEVIEAAKSVYAHEFIMQMEKGYYTEVNERGSRLSTGQKQLISFARALLADPRILILDEATASIDTHTEILIQQALEKLLQGRTSFIIAHRLSTIRRVDRIMVVDQGKIIESGTHDELITQQGAYYQLCKAQYNFMNAI